MLSFARVKYLYYPGLLLLPLLFMASACTTSILPDTAKLPLVIRGIDNSLRDNVQAMLAPELALPVDSGDATDRLRQLARRAPRLVTRALEPYGYYSPVTVTAVRDKTLYLTIETGEPVRVSQLNVTIEDSDVAKFPRRPEFPLQPGDILLHERYEQGKAELIDFALEHGFLEARLSRHTVTVDPASHTAEIALVLVSGTRYRVGPVRFRGAPDYPDTFLRRYLTLEAGSPLTHSALAASRQQLRGSDRFERVHIRPELDLADAQGEAPILVELEPKARRELRPGIGYGTDTGARFSLRYQDLNLFRRGHELLASGLLAELENRINLNYTLPGADLNTRTTLQAGYEQQDVESYETSYSFAEIEQLWGIGNRHIVALFARYQLEDSDIAGDEISSQFLLGGLRYRQSRLDNPRRPTRGYHLSLELRGSDENLVSEVSLGQLLGAARLILPLHTTVLLHLRGNAAATFQDNEFEEIPASLRFFAGGDRSVRGYAYQSLGPENSEGDVVGGKNLLAGSLETEWRFLENWSVAAFYDTGNAFDSFSDMELAEGAGAGIRYYSLVGPVWLDLARTVNTRDPDYRLHFGLGISW